MTEKIKHPLHTPDPHIYNYLSIYTRITRLYIDKINENNTTNNMIF